MHRLTMARLALAALLLLPALASAACTGHANCSYNGACVSGACACFPQWRGAACQSLALEPTDRNLGYQPVMWPDAAPGFRNATTWGGQAIRHDDGTYHSE